MTTPHDVRETVSNAYAELAKRPRPEGSTCCEPIQKGMAVQSAGYTKEELGALPADAVENSFGCGNPLAFSEVKEGEVVVDLGSGAGIDVLIAAGKVGPTGRAIGVDMTDEMLERARTNIERAGVTNAEMRKGLIEAMPVDDASVDWVISNCVINLSPEKPKVFAEIARVLKPGGRMLVSDIVCENLPAEVLSDDRLYSGCIAGAISEADYLQGLRDAGLVNVEVRDRIVYEASQIEVFVSSELSDCESGGCCDGSTAAAKPALGKLAASLAGKVWSANIYAEKRA